MSKLILWALESKEGSNNKPTAKSKGDSKLLGENDDDREEQGECNEDEEDTARQKQTEIDKCFPRRKSASGRLEVARYISHTFRNPKQETTAMIDEIRLQTLVKLMSSTMLPTSQIQLIVSCIFIHSYLGEWNGIKEKEVYLHVEGASDGVVSRPNGGFEIEGDHGIGGVLRLR